MGEGVCVIAQVKEFLQLHPVIRLLLTGTMVMRAARSMSIPFLAIYLRRTTGLTPDLVGMIIGLGFLASTIGGIFGGSLSDRFGRQKVMLSSLFVWSIVFMLFSVGKSLPVLVLISLLNGLCNSFFEPVSKALMADLSENTQRLRIFSLRYLAINIGGAIGPLLGAYLGLAASATPFLLAGSVYFTYATVLTWKLRNVDLQWSTSAGEAFRLKVVWHTLRSDVALRFFVLGGVIWMLGYSQMDSTLVQYLNQTVPDAIKLFSVLITVNTMTVILLQMPLTRLFEKRSPLTSIAVGNTLFALGNVGFAFSWGWATFILSMFLFTLGEILSFPATNVLLDELAPNEMRGTYYGIQNLYNIGQALGPWVGGLILGAYGGTRVFVAVALSAVVGLAVFWHGRQQHLRSLADRQRQPVGESV